MMKRLQNPWLASVLGLLIYLGTTAGVLLPHAAPKNTDNLATPSGNSQPGPSWTFQNPEVDQLIKELRDEKKALGDRQAQLNELAARIEAERQEMNQATQTVHQLQQQFDQVVTRVREEELSNLKKLARTYASMSPEGASAILLQLDDTTIVKIMAFMKEAETAPILEMVAKTDDASAKRIAMISEKLRLSLANQKSAAKPTR